MKEMAHVGRRGFRSRPRSAPFKESRMPRYEYRCLECHDVFECCEGMDEHEAARPKCPQCGSRKVEQVFSSFFAKTRRKS